MQLAKPDIDPRVQVYGMTRAPSESMSDLVLRARAGTQNARDRIDPDAGGTTVKSLLNDMLHGWDGGPHSPTFRPDPWFESPRNLGPVRVAVVRFQGTVAKTLAAADDLKPNDGVLLRDVVEGKAKNEIVHQGDFIVLFGGRLWKEKPAATEVPNGNGRPGGKLK